MTGTIDRIIRQKNIIMVGIKNTISRTDTTADMFTKRCITTVITENTLGAGETIIINPRDTTAGMFTKRFIITTIMENMSGAGETDIISPGGTTVKDMFTKKSTIMTVIIGSIAATRTETKRRKWFLKSF